VISTRNANTMHSMMQDVVRYGTATKANVLKRNDLAGKTGTTNESHDAWFAGYASQVVGITWVGFDQPKSLGDKETGGGVALPIWIDYMAKVLPKLPEVPRKVATEPAPPFLDGINPAPAAPATTSSGTGAAGLSGANAGAGLTLAPSLKSSASSQPLTAPAAAAVATPQ
jgi:penicillin-binding protein 1A